MQSVLAGIGVASYVNGTGTAATFNSPRGIVCDDSSNLFVVDFNNFRIRKITKAGVVTTLAGSGTAGNTNGNGAAASFGRMTDIAIDKSGNLYVADTTNNQIRKITKAGVVTTYAGLGTAISLNMPTSIDIDTLGNIYVGEANGNDVRKISSTGSGSIILAGTFTPGSADGLGNSGDPLGNVARFNSPSGIAVANDGSVYVADKNNNKIRKISSGLTVYPPSVSYKHMKLPTNREV